jgi:ABC-type transporter Mla subunit MlaD
MQVGAKTFNAIGSQSAAVEQLVAQLPPTLTQMRGSFGQLQVTLADVRPTLTALLPAAHALPAGLAALRAFATPATPALKALVPALDALSPLARNLPPTASALHTAFNTLAAQAPRLDRITAKVIPCELPVDKFFAWTLSVLKFGSASNRTSGPRGLLVVPPSSGDPTVRDPTLEPVTGCADGRPPPK